MEVMTVKGKKVTFYSIGEFAAEIDRDSQTIRKWEYKGVLPPTAFKRRTGVRIYPEEMVKQVKKLCKKYKLQQGKVIPEGFKRDVAVACKEVTDRIIEGGDTE